MFGGFIEDFKKFIGALFKSKDLFQKKEEPPIALTKVDKNPLVSPRDEYSWESWQTFNPGVVLLNDNVHFVYRAIGNDGISRVGYAFSEDGFSIDKRSPYPVYEHKKGQKAEFNIYSAFSGGSFGGAEDPRLVRVGDEGVLYMTYTACEGSLRMGLTSIRVEDFLNSRWRWKSPSLISPPNEIHKNWVIFPEKINGKYAILHTLNPEIKVEYRDSLDFEEGEYIESVWGGLERDGCWDKWIRGPGAPPVKTDEGWLLFYHAMGEEYSQYKVGAMLLDLEDPTKILHRSHAPVLEPDKDYENNGFKPGVVYVSGAVVKDGRLLVYYGGSDSYVCLAHIQLQDFIESLKEGRDPEIKKEKLRSKE